MSKRFLVSVLFAFCIAMVACTSDNVSDNPTWKELYRIDVSGKYGFINEKGDIIIEPMYDKAYFLFGDSVCYAEMGNRKGLIDPTGKFVVELSEDISWVWMFSNGSATCRGVDNKYGIIRKDGTMLLEMVYKKISKDDEEGYIVEDTNGNMGYVNQMGEFIVPCRYDAVNGFNEGLMVVATGNKCGYVDTMGQWVIDSIYDDARAFGNGLARVKLNDKWMFIDKKGNIIENLNYDEILTGFSNNRAFVKNGDSILMIDKKGNEICEVIADSVYGFKEGYATFKSNGKFGKLDTTGAIVIPAKFDNIFGFSNGLAVFNQNGKQGLVDTAGNIIIKASHDNICQYNENSLILVIDNIYQYNENSLILLVEDNDGNITYTWYDQKGNLIWKDIPMPGKSFSFSKVPTKKDFITMLDSRLSDLDPIEGVYYVSFNKMAVDRDNGSSSSNGSESKFCAIINSNDNEYVAYLIGTEMKLDTRMECWVKKFVKIGESNVYAVVNHNDSESKWAEDGKLVLEDPYKFEVTLRQGGNNWYNWYVQCEFVKDYPPASVYEQIQKAEWTGTGFAIADGYIATNYHVTNGAKTINIKGINGDMKESYKGYVVASDKENDISIIKIVDKDFESLGTIPYTIGKTNTEVGDEIFVLGYPMTETMGEEIKLTDGLISATTGYKGSETMYQISAAVQPGNSGGPLFNSDGAVIGIVCAKHEGAENANYAVKVSYLYNLINSSNLGIDISGNDNVKSKKLSKKVKKLRNYVYLIECSTR